MSKNRNALFAVVILMIIIGGGLTAYFLLGSKIPKSSQSSALLTNDASSVVKGDLTYEDSSGFHFNYPSGIKISDETPNDDSYYTLLELTKSGLTLKITVKDTTYKTPDEWVKSSEAPKGLTLSGAITLSNIPAKQFSNSSQLVSVAIDAGILYLIGGPKDGGFWEETQSVIASSFAFAGEKSTAVGAGSDSAIYEEEEIVE